jgi:hypothetical protein
MIQFMRADEGSCECPRARRDHLLMLDIAAPVPEMDSGVMCQPV